MVSASPVAVLSILGTLIATVPFASVFIFEADPLTWSDASWVASEVPKEDEVPVDHAEAMQAFRSLQAWLVQCFVSSLICEFAWRGFKAYRGKNAVLEHGDVSSPRSSESTDRDPEFSADAAEEAASMRSSRSASAILAAENGVQTELVWEYHEAESLKLLEDARRQAEDGYMAGVRAQQATLDGERLEFHSQLADARERLLALLGVKECLEKQNAAQAARLEKTYLSLLHMEKKLRRSRHETEQAQQVGLRIEHERSLLAKELGLLRGELEAERATSAQLRMQLSLTAPPTTMSKQRGSPQRPSLPPLNLAQCVPGAAAAAAAAAAGLKEPAEDPYLMQMPPLPRTRSATITSVESDDEMLSGDEELWPPVMQRSASEPVKPPLSPADADRRRLPSDDTLTEAADASPQGQSDDVANRESSFCTGSSSSSSSRSTSLNRASSPGRERTAALSAAALAEQPPRTDEAPTQIAPPPLTARSTGQLLTARSTAQLTSRSVAVSVEHFCAEVPIPDEDSDFTPTIQNADEPLTIIVEDQAEAQSPSPLRQPAVAPVAFVSASAAAAASEAAPQESAPGPGSARKAEAPAAQAPAPPYWVRAVSGGAMSAMSMTSMGRAVSVFSIADADSEEMQPQMSGFTSESDELVEDDEFMGTALHKVRTYSIGEEDEECPPISPCVFEAFQQQEAQEEESSSAMRGEGAFVFSIVEEEQTEQRGEPLTARTSERNAALVGSQEAEASQAARLEESVSGPPQSCGAADTTAALKTAQAQKSHSAELASDDAESTLAGSSSDISTDPTPPPSVKHGRIPAFTFKEPQKLGAGQGARSPEPAEVARFPWPSPRKDSSPTQQATVVVVAGSGPQSSELAGSGSPSARMPATPPTRRHSSAELQKTATGGGGDGEEDEGEGLPRPLKYPSASPRKRFYLVPSTPPVGGATPRRRESAGSDMSGVSAPTTPMRIFVSSETESTGSVRARIAQLQSKTVEAPRRPLHNFALARSPRSAAAAAAGVATPRTVDATPRTAAAAATATPRTVAVGQRARLQTAPATPSPRPCASEKKVESAAEQMRQKMERRRKSLEGKEKAPTQPPSCD
eukprot:TRINITY_DN10255_c1_g1_i2.p1 TRINITY_DN10255_c1_g1~~TRINITY_DN10255_c1_g1_i2.p1  ORF type:complete len:1090 (+),score=298.03 TRINITY_DN10255_c1_g1_i2:142-3411(+)